MVYNLFFINKVNRFFSGDFIKLIYLFIHNSFAHHPPTTMSLQRMPTMSQEIVVDYNELKNGTPQQVEEQLHRWMNGTNPSIFIQFIPDEMNEDGLRRLFDECGPIDRVEFVPKKNADGKQIGRMVFIHFNHFSDVELAMNIIHSHPEPYELEWSASHKQKMFTLKCRINVRPIQRVEYTPSQLTDMFESLNDRVMTQMKDYEQQVKDLTLSVAELRQTVAHLTSGLPIAPGLQIPFESPSGFYTVDGRPIAPGL